MGGLVQNLGAGYKFKCSPEKARNPGQRFLLQAAENNNNNTTHTHTNPLHLLEPFFQKQPLGASLWCPEGGGRLININHLSPHCSAFQSSHRISRFEVGS